MYVDFIDREAATPLAKAAYLDMGSFSYYESSEQLSLSTS
jgi:hypothetical protein